MNIRSYETNEIKTNRLILKKGTIDDFVLIYEYDMRRLRDINGEFEYTLQDANVIRSWFKDGIDRFYADCIKEHIFDWIIYLKDGMIPIGHITADREREDIVACELSFNLHPNYWGNGYMPEAIGAILDYLFDIGYENVILGWDEGNKKSQRVSEKLKFQLFDTFKESWFKNGVPITLYESIMSKQKWQQLKLENDEVSKKQMG